MIKSIISSMLSKYYRQNTDITDYWKITMDFYKYLKDRGWTRAALEPVFVRAHNNIISPPPREAPAADQITSKETAIIHFVYNRCDVQRKRVREIWDETCGLLQKDVKDGGLGIKRMICAYSRPRNLKDLLQRAKLHENADHRSSSYF